MRVLMATKYWHKGGVMSHIKSLGGEFVKNGHCVVLLAPVKNDDIKSEIQKLGIILENIDFNSKNIIGNVLKIVQISKKYMIDVFHSHDRVCSLTLKPASRLLSIPFIWTAHLNNIPNTLIFKLLTFAGDKNIAVSSEIREYCLRNFNIKEKNITVIPNGIDETKYYKLPTEDIDEIKTCYGIKNDETVIVILSRLEEIKGHKYLIEALNEINAQNRFKFKVLITGQSRDDGSYKRSLEVLIDKYRLGNHIVFTGNIDPNMVLNISDLFVLPSINEGQSIAMLEAFACGVPVIRTKTGGYEDAKDYCIGVEPGSSNDLRDALLDYFNGRLPLIEMSISARKYVFNNCTVSSMATKTMEIYNSVFLNRNRNK